MPWILRILIYRLVEGIKDLIATLITRYYKLINTQVVTIEGIKIALIKEQPETVLKRLYLKTYEREELEFITAYLEPEDVVMELGTGLGFLSSYCAKKIGSERVFTYEANPTLESYIRQTYYLNNIAPNLEFCLLGNQKGEQKFYINKEFYASSTIQQSDEDTIIDVHLKDFNQEIERINPSFLIVDIEGGEYELLKEAKFYGIKKILIELHQNVLDSNQIELIMSNFIGSGFHLKKQSGWVAFLQRD